MSPKPAVVTSAGPPDLALDQRVGDERRGVHDRRRDLGRPHAGLGEQLAHAGRTPSSGAAGVVSVLSTTTRPDAASSSTTSVNVPPMSTASRQSAVVRSGRRRSALRAQVVARRGEHVEDPALAVLVVADEDAVAVPHRRAAPGRPRRRRAPRASRSSGSPMRKSSVPRMMMPSCSLSTWWCRNEPVGAAVDAPEAQLQVLAGDHPPAEAGTVGLVGTASSSKK